MEIGERIAKYRIEKGLSQDELAHLLGYKSRSTIYNIESGKRDVPRKMIAKLSIILNVSPIDLLQDNKESSSLNKREALQKLLEEMPETEIDDIYNDFFNKK